LSTRSLIKTGAGQHPKPVKVNTGAEGNITERAVATLNNFMLGIVRKLNGKLSLGDGSQSSLTGNLYGQYIEFTTPSTPDEQFQVDHGLGKAPAARIIVRQNKAAHLYDSNLGGWGDNSIYLKCDVASVLFKIALFADPGV